VRNKAVSDLGDNAKPNNSGLGVGVGLLLCGLCFLAFPVYAGLAGWPMWALRIIGFILLLIGIMGTCIEAFKRKQ
jgi:hypothetical membrane protein